MMSGPLQSLANQCPHKIQVGDFSKKKCRKTGNSQQRIQRSLDKSIKFFSKSEYIRDIDKICDELDRKRRKEQKRFHKEIEQDSCIVL